MNVWLALRIGVLYAAPAFAIVVALAYFVWLWRCVRRGDLVRTQAAGRFAWLVLLLPLAVVLVVWGMGELASYFAVGGDQYVFDSAVSMQFLLSLAPLAGYVLVPILVLFAALLLLPARRR